MSLKNIIPCLLTLFTYTVFGCPITIHLKDSTGKNLSNTTIKTQNGVVGKTDKNGTLVLSLAEGNTIFEITPRNRESQFISYNIQCSERTIILALENNESIIEIDEVKVKSFSKQALIEQSPFSVQSIDLSESYHKSGSVMDVLNRETGIKIRTDGSLGGDVQINLGGLQGKAVRIFKDGIPVELFGHGFSLSTIPNNMLERVDVYKGVMPISLASDALGGGVNLVSRNSQKNNLAVSYELGSFNTHRATVNGFFIDKVKNLYAGINGSINYSDNNYKVNVPFYDANTSETTYKNVKRFHDATKSYYVETYFGAKNKTWADDIRLTLINSGFHKEIQNDAEMKSVYGQAFSKENNFTSLINYKKSLLDDKLKIDFLGAYSHFKTKFIDTATVKYNWDGEIIARNQRPGEVNLGNNQQLTYDFISTRINLSYKILPHHFIELNDLFYRQNRIGSDSLGAISAIENIDVLTVPSHYQKNVLGLGLRSNWLNNKLESVVAVKHFSYKTKGYTTDNFGLGWISTNNDNDLGYLAGLRFSQGNYLFKLSYENAYRLPDEYEIFGDARLVKENMDLKPEKSHNLNFNVDYNTKKTANNFALSGGLFYRKVEDIIFLQLDIPFNRYINYEKAEVKGVEVEANYIPNSRWNIGFNATYQDIRRVDISEAVFKNLENSRIPNVPYLFGNFWFNSNFKNIFNKQDRLDFNWNANYTHRFFLHAIPKNQEPPLFGSVDKIETSLLIPRDGRVGQFSHNAGIYYHFANQKLALSLECRNIGNVRLYDNFNVQKPGRSFNFKILYNIL